MAIQLFCATFDTDECLKQIKECLEKGWTGMGFKTVQFEEMWKKYTGLEHAYYLNSSTAGLNLAVNTLKDIYKWQDEDEIITTPLTFISTNHAILKSKMKAVFADIDDTLCLDPNDVEKKITSKTRAIMFVGFGGNIGQYDKIVNIANKYNLKIILDAAHMAGTRYADGRIPGKDDADIIVYSYQAVKNLPTGDSGMICCKDAEIDRIVREKAWLGINKDTYSRSVNNESTYKWKYDVEYVGNKYNGNSIMASVAIAQLPHLDQDNAYRRTLAMWYTEAFSKYPDQIALVNIPKNCISSRHLFQIMIPDRNGLLNYLNTKEIYPGVHYTPNTEYRMYEYAKGTCPNADWVGEHILSLPMHMHVTYEDVQYITKCVIEYLINIKHGEKLEKPIFIK